MAENDLLGTYILFERGGRNIYIGLPFSQNKEAIFIVPLMREFSIIPWYFLTHFPALFSLILPMLSLGKRLKQVGCRWSTHICNYLRHSATALNIIGYTSLAYCTRHMPRNHLAIEVQHHPDFWADLLLQEVGFQHWRSELSNNPLSSTLQIWI